MFFVPIGYTKKGRERRRYFSDLQSAAQFCGAVFDKTGIVLTILEKKKGGGNG